MELHQQISGQVAQKKIDAEAQKYAAKIKSGEWTLETAHLQLGHGTAGGTMSLFAIAGLAKAIACFQCSK